MWMVSIDSLLRNNTESKGCPFCNKLIKAKSYFNGLTNRKPKIINELSEPDDYEKYDKRLIRLLREDLQSYYLLGFLMADGHFYKNGRIKLEISQKDKEVMFKICDYLKIKPYENKNSIGFNIMDVYTSDILKYRFKISNRKTYDPCYIKKIKNKKIIAWFIGFVDGDGSILYRTDNKNPKISLHIHKNWYRNIEYISKEIYDYFKQQNYAKPSIIGDYLYYNICSQNIINGIIEFIDENNLFVMDRKWNKIRR